MQFVLRTKTGQRVVELAVDPYVRDGRNVIARGPSLGLFRCEWVDRPVEVVLDMDELSAVFFVELPESAPRLWTGRSSDVAELFSRDSLENTGLSGQTNEEEKKHGGNANAGVHNTLPSLERLRSPGSARGDATRGYFSQGGMRTDVEMLISRSDLCNGFVCRAD
ncbi:MAG: hypothetical protein R3E12_15285 [Candidatus Eisenbacteria bacterium]